MFYFEICMECPYRKRCIREAQLSSLAGIFDIGQQTYFVFLDFFTALNFDPYWCLPKKFHHYGMMEQTYRRVVISITKNTTSQYGKGYVQKDIRSQWFASVYCIRDRNNFTSYYWSNKRYIVNGNTLHRGVYHIRKSAQRSRRKNITERPYESRNLEKTKW